MGEYLNWKSRRAGVLPVHIQRPENQESQCLSSSPKAGRLETQEELMFQFESVGRKNSHLLEGRSLFLLYSGLQLIK